VSGREGRLGDGVGGQCEPAAHVMRSHFAGCISLLSIAGEGGERYEGGPKREVEQKTRPVGFY